MSEHRNSYDGDNDPKFDYLGRLFKRNQSQVTRSTRTVRPAYTPRSQRQGGIGSFIGQVIRIVILVLIVASLIYLITQVIYPFFITKGKEMERESEARRFMVMNELEEGLPTHNEWMTVRLKPQEAFVIPTDGTLFMFKVANKTFKLERSLKEDPYEFIDPLIVLDGRENPPLWLKDSLEVRKTKAIRLTSIALDGDTRIPIRRVKFNEVYKRR